MPEISFVEESGDLYAVVGSGKVEPSGAFFGLEDRVDDIELPGPSSCAALRPSPWH